jgi:sec-independent protein translocase protein TatC
VAVIPKRRRRKNPTGTMTLVEHLGELRTRLMVAIGAVAVGAVIGWFMYEPIFNFLRHGFCTFMSQHPELAVDPKEPCRLAYTTILEPFTTKIKVVSVTGMLLALPVLLWELWAFIVPGLTAKERKFAIPFVVSSVVLFGFGAWFGLVTLPRALNFLLGFAGTGGVVLVMSVGRYISFVTLVIAAFGISFEFPLLLVSLMAVGVLSSQKLRAWRRYAIVGIAIFAAVITPSQDWFTMTAMMVPLLIFYEVAILIGRFLMKK